MLTVNLTHVQTHQLPRMCCLVHGSLIRDVQYELFTEGFLGFLVLYIMNET